LTIDIEYLIICLEHLQGGRRMKVKFYGTRGSVPISRNESSKFGGNTTCLRIESEAVPPRWGLAIDGGTGIVPLGTQNFGLEKLVILFTHWHHDHTQGLPLCPLTFVKECKIICIGPVEDGMGPREVFEKIMRPPLFPVHFVEVASHFECHPIEYPHTKVIVFHLLGGLRMLTLEDFEVAEGAKWRQLEFGGGHFPLSECLIVKMLKTNHPERTISYRLEERSTGRVFVFLTDHENTEALPTALISHLKGADLLVMDAQYSREKYDKQTAGFGHATPDYCARVAVEVGAKRLGLTHHDPFSNDKIIEEMAEAARKYLKKQGAKIEVFACADYLEVEV